MTCTRLFRMCVIPQQLSITNIMHRSLQQRILSSNASGIVLLQTETEVIKEEGKDILQRPKATDSQSGVTALDDPVANKFINCMMYDGKKALSRRIFNQALERIKENQIEKFNSTKDSKIELDPMVIFRTAINNCRPLIGVQTVKRGGKSYQVPIPIKEKRQYFLSIKWFITITRNGKEHGMAKKLAKEFIDAYKNEGAVVRKKIELHKMAESNRAYAHYRWW